MFHEFEGHDIQIALVSENPKWFWSKPCVAGILNFPFEELGVERITGIVSRKNKKIRRLSKMLGFREEGIMRRGYNGRTDAVILGLLKKENRFLNGQETKAA